MHIPPRTTIIGITILWTVIIFTLCALPGDAIPNPRFNIPYIDKIVHGGLFFVASLLLIFPLVYYSHLARWKSYLIACIYTVVYGGLIEILQDYFFNRSGEIYDLLADFAGAVVACLSYPMILHILRRKK